MPPPTSSCPVSHPCVDLCALVLTFLTVELVSCFLVSPFDEDGATYKYKKRVNARKSLAERKAQEEANMPVDPLDGLFGAD